MDIKALQADFRGEILTPGSAEYEVSRRVWNAMIDRRPAAIARCFGPADVRAAVQFAVEQDIHPAIRGGGHNVAGLAMIDDGLVVDLTRMKGIFVDAARRTATAQTGLTWGEFDRETHLYGLATTGGLISTTGIAGLTLGGVGLPFCRELTNSQKQSEPRQVQGAQLLARLGYVRDQVVEGGLARDRDEESPSRPGQEGGDCGEARRDAQQRCERRWLRLDDLEAREKA